MPLARLNKESQVSIPPEVRSKVGLELGDEVWIDAQDDQIVIRKTSESALDLLAQLPPEIWAGAADEIDRARDEWDR